MKVIYYSRNTLLPALLAAALHCRPSLDFAQGLALVGKAHELQGSLQAGIKHYADCADGTGVFAMTFTAPPLLVENTLHSLLPLLGGTAGQLLLVSARPGGGRRLSDLEMRGMWAEVCAAVKKARLYLAPVGCRS